MNFPFIKVQRNMVHRSLALQLYIFQPFLTVPANMKNRQMLKCRTRRITDKFPYRHILMGLIRSFRL